MCRWRQAVSCDVVSCWRESMVSPGTATAVGIRPGMNENP